MTDQTPVERPFNFTRLWTQIEQEAMRGLIAYMTRREFMKAKGAGAIVAAIGPLAQLASPASAQDDTHGAQTAPGQPHGIGRGRIRRGP